MWSRLRNGNASIEGAIWRGERPVPPAIRRLGRALEPVLGIGFLAVVHRVIYGGKDSLFSRLDRPTRLALAAVATYGLLPGSLGLAEPPAATMKPPEAAVALSPQDLAFQILHRSLHESVWGPPAMCDIRQSIQLFDKRMSGFGTYVRGGQGTGKLKVNLQFPAGEHMNNLLQVSDGQRMQTIEQIGGKSRVTVIDLGKIRERLIITTESLGDPVIAMHLAIGGQAEVLRKLCQQYEWTQVREGKHGDVDVWWLSGRLTYSPPPIHASAQIDLQLFVEKQTGILPTQIHVAIGRQESAIPFWLYQVEQSRTHPPESKTVSTSDLYVNTEWAEPDLLAQPPSPDYFQPGASNGPAQEETSTYLPPPMATATQPPQAVNR